jgi:peptidoglycan/xylan/chitin deacetylase (PgdA/CDA1 family)
LIAMPPIKQTMRPPVMLAYHAVGDVPRELDPDNLVVPVDHLRMAVENLRGRGYEFLTAADFARRVNGGRPADAICALTFDDGSEDNATVLPGLLAELGVPATLYVCPGLLGAPHPWLAPGADVRIMTREQLLATATHEHIEIGSHTVRHADLEHADAEQAYRELAESKRVLEELLGRPVPSFAYPYGHYSAACPAAAERAGYESAATAGERGSWNRFELHRELIGPDDWRLRFELKARGWFRPLVESPPMRLRRRLLGREHVPSSARQGSVGSL